MHQHTSKLMRASHAQLLIMRDLATAYLQDAIDRELARRAQTSVLAFKHAQLRTPARLQGYQRKAQ